MTTLYASPYDIDAATGFYFESLDEYQKKSATHFNRFGGLVEEFEMQLIDTDDAQLFLACSINQANINEWFDDIEILDDHEKISLYYLLACAGYTLEQALNKLDDPSIAESSLRDAAEDLFDECWLDSVPDLIKHYIDYDKFASDCEIAGDLVEFEYEGNTFTCTNASGL